MHTRWALRRAPKKLLTSARVVLAYPQLMNILPQLKSLDAIGADRKTSLYGVAVIMWRRTGGWGTESS